MEESSTYQAILEKGRIQERIAVLREVGKERFGFLKPEVEKALASVTDPARLARMRKRMLKAADWDDLLRTP